MRSAVDSGACTVVGAVLMSSRDLVVGAAMIRSFGGDHAIRRAPGPVMNATTRLPPSPGRAADPITDLHQLIGNQAVQRLLSRLAADDAGGGQGPGAGQPLDAATRQFMESWAGRDLGGVRIHTGAPAADSARSLGAQAYTVGSHIVFGANRYDPRSPSGARLLAHELVHVAQARGRPLALRRRPDPARLDAAVPVPMDVPRCPP